MKRFGICIFVLVTFGGVSWLLLNALAAGAAENKPANQPAAEATEADKALAARVERAIAAAEGTPGQEAANVMRSGWVKNLLPVLKGETQGNLALARREFSGAVGGAEKGPTWPRPKPVHAPRAAAPPRIDGVLDDPAWATAATFTGMHPFNETTKVDSPKTVWKVMWDEKHLYFGFECADADILAPRMKRDDHVYFHDCVEMFILPEWRSKAYWEIVISPSGMLFDGLHSKMDQEFGCVSRPFEDVKGLRFQCRVDGTVGDSTDTDKGYCVEVAVPFDQLPGYTRGNKPAAGQVLHFMLVRLDKNGEKMIPYAFQPLLNWGHNIWNHAELRLVDKAKAESAERAVIHYVCVKCQHEFEKKLHEFAASDLETGIRMPAAGGPAVLLDCPSCKATQSCWPAMQCPKCKKWFISQQDVAFMRYCAAQQPIPEAVWRIRSKCPHCGTSSPAPPANLPAKGG